MKEGWEYKKLDDICTIVGRIGFRGYTKADLVNSSKDGAITLSPSNIINGELDYSKCTYINWDKYFESPEIMLENGDIVLVKTASIGKCAVVKNLPHEATLNPQFVVLKQLSGVSDFICYYLKSSIAQNTIKQMAGGVAIPTLSQKKLGMMIVPAPSLSEQQSIVDYLDSAFAKIDAMKANAEKSLNEAKALFQASLKDMLEPKEGWESVKLINIYNFIDYRGATPKKITEGVPLVTAKNVKLGYIDYTIKDYISEEEYKQRQSRGISHKGDLLFTTEAPLGNVAIADLERFSAGQRLITLQKYKDSKHEIDNRFYYYYMLGPLFQKKIQSLATGATALGIKAKILKEVEVPLPTNEDQQRIVATLDSLKSKVDRLQANFEKISQECDALKQALLREVFEG